MKSCAETLYIISTLAGEASGALLAQSGECPARYVRAFRGNLARDEPGAGRARLAACVSSAAEDVQIMWSIAAAFVAAYVGNSSVEPTNYS